MVGGGGLSMMYLLIDFNIKQCRDLNLIVGEIHLQVVKLKLFFL